MGKNRFIPFGYVMDNGKIIVQENETGFVKIMFEQYVRGLSFNEIAGIMNNANIPYNENASIWNKNMVKRIIDNEIYIGNETYPPNGSLKGKVSKVSKNFLKQIITSLPVAMKNGLSPQFALYYPTKNT